MPVKTMKLSGWGRHPVMTCPVVRPEKREALRAVVTGGGSLIAHGAGRSYGDAALNASGRTVLMRRLNRMLTFDETTGLLRCEAGVTLAEILSVFVPRGWFLPVTPGTKHVTVGGAAAFDVHGKNHHCDGSFGRFVRWIDLLTASGETLRCSPTANAGLFHATLGGAGLTGIITEIAFTLRRIPSAYIHERRIKARDLDDALALFDAYEADYPYSVAWIDGLAPGRSLGRSLLLFGRHAAPDELDPRRRAHPFALPEPRRLAVPFDLPSGLLNPASVRAFNALYYARQTGRERHVVTGLDAYFYPLDFLRNWNRMYGRRGFVQFQCVFPPETSRTALIELLTRTSREGRGSFLAVLKRFGPASDGLLSFPMPGYTLALDLPMRKGLPAFLDALTRLVLEHGGRVYLAKDAHLGPEAFRAMYPAFPLWRTIKDRIDPEHRFASALSERLALTHRHALTAAA